MDWHLAMGAAALHYLIISLGYFMQAFADPNHRVWNDIKLAAQRTRSFLWKSIIQLMLVFNLNYGPYGQGHWFEEKKEKTARRTRRTRKTRRAKSE